MASIQGAGGAGSACACAGRHDAAEMIGERGVDAAGIRQMIERQRIVEAAHLDRPFDRLAAPVECERAVRRARDRHHPQIDLRRERPVDLKLRLAGGLALLQRGEIQKRKPHRALDLQRALAGQEYRGRMGVDPFDRGPPWVAGSASRASTGACGSSPAFIPSAFRSTVSPRPTPRGAAACQSRLPRNRSPFYLTTPWRTERSGARRRVQRRLL